MKRYLLLFFTVLMYVGVSAQCNYSLRLIDSYGDGWNGNTMDLLINGTVVIDDITLPAGNQMDTVFSVNAGDAITTVWNGGGTWGSETSYKIIDANNLEVGTAAQADISTAIVAACPACLVPTSVMFSNLTTTSADLAWTAGGSETTWNVEYGSAGFTQGSGTTVTASTNPYTLTGLSDATSYDFYVQADCGGTDGTSAWVGPYSFFTPCNTVSSFPSTENFDALTANDGSLSGCQSSDNITNCWSNDATNTNNWVARSTATGSGNTGPSADYSGTGNYVFIESSSCFNNTSYLNSPNYDFSSLTIPQVTFWYHLYGATTGSLDLEISTDNGATWTSVWSLSGDQGDEWKEVTVSLAAYTSATNATLRFKGLTGSGYTSDMAIDNFSIAEAPACAKPTVLTAANMDFSSADISWTAGGTETNWEIVAQAAGTGVPTAAGTATTSNPHSLTGLTSETNYEVYVRAVCGSDVSEWAGPLTFYTGYCLPSSTNENTYVDAFSTAGGNQNIFNTGTGYSTGGYANNSTSFVESYAGGNFNFNAEIVGGSAGFAIWVDWNNDLTFDDATEKVFNTTNYSNGPFTGTVTIPAGTPLGDYRMRITTNYWASNPSLPCENTQRAEFEDYTITVGTPPSCPTVSAISATNVTATSIEVAWTASGSETTWEVMAQPAGMGTPSTAGTSTTSNPHTATGLTPATDYDVYVRADCGGGDLSPWAGPVSFTTACAPITPPYTQDFSSMTWSNIPNCWEEGYNTQVIDGPNGQNGSWTVDGFMNNGTTGAARINVWGTTKNDWFVSPEFNIPATGSFKVKYDFAITGYSNTDPEVLGSDDQVLFLVSANNGPWTTLKSYDNSYVTPVGGDLEVSLGLEDYSGQVLRFAFWASSGTVSDPQDVNVYVDNFIVEEKLANDVGVVGITAPNSGCVLGMESITIQVKNFGSSTQGGFFTHYAVNGVTQTVSPDGFVPNNITTEDTIDYTFTTQYDFSALGEYEIKAWTALDGDGKAANDTIAITVTNQPLISSFPHTEDFETSNGGYKVINKSSSSSTVWELGTPAGSIINTAASGTNAWVTNLAGDYTANANTHLISPCYDFSSLSNDPVLSFALWTNTQVNYDGVAVFMSFDQGDSWQRVGSENDSDWYNSTSSFFPGLDGSGIFSGLSAYQWDTVSHSLAGAAGKPSVKLMYVFRSSGYTHFEGVGIDDISIVDPCASGFGLTANVTNATTPQATDGAVTINNTMGTAPFSYAWSTGNAADSTQMLSNLSAGTYTVTVTDAIGCQEVLEVVVGPTCGDDVISLTYTAESQNSVTQDGSITATISSTNPPYTLAWSHGAASQTTSETTVTLGNLHAGWYAVTLTDAQGCTDVDSIVVTATCPVTLDVAMSSTEETSAGAADGTATATPNAGVAPYTYAWSTGATTQTISNLSAATYCVTVTDANGCTESNCVTLSSPCPSDLGLTLAVTHETTIDSNDGAITASVTAGTAPFQYTWSNGATGNTVVDLTPGDYTVTVVDANNCTATASATVNESTVSTPIDEVEGLQSLSIVPNPTTGKSILSVSFDRTVDMEIEIVNVVGQQIQKQQFSQINQEKVEIDLSQAPQGVYLIRLKVGSDVHTERMVKQ